MKKPETVKENKMHKILRDSEIQTDYPIMARTSDLVLINRRTYLLGNFIIPIENSGKRKDIQIP